MILNGTGVKLIEKKCKICNIIFLTTQNRIKYGRGKCCSRKCQYISNSKTISKTIILNCIVCNKIIKRCPSKIKSKYQFCSRDCAYKGRRLGYVKRIVKKINKICDFCKIEFHTLNKNKKYCSQKCFRESMVIKKLTRVKKVKIEINKICDFCKIEFHTLNKNKKYCSRLCFEKSHKIRMLGKNNPSYIDGRSKNKRCYRGDDWETIRKEVYKRDKWLCQICGKHCGKYEIQAHHIEPWYKNKNNNMDNLITVCNKCHRKIELKRKR